MRAEKVGARDGLCCKSSAHVGHPAAAGSIRIPITRSRLPPVGKAIPFECVSFHLIKSMMNTDMKTAKKI